MYEILTDSTSHQKFTASVFGRFSDSQVIKLDGIKLLSIYMEVLVFCTWLTFDLFLRPRSINEAFYRLGILPYEFWHMSRNNISISRIMYSKIPTKRKISTFFGFRWPSKMSAGRQASPFR